MKNLTRNQWIAVVVALAVIAFLMYGGAFLNFFNTGTVAAPVDQTAPAAVTTNTPTTMQSGVQVIDEVVGTGTAAAAGDTISALYTGTLADGTVFDASSLHGNQPISFQLGTGQVIKGWDQGLVGMKVGGKRKLIISPDYAYGAQQVGAIPANSTLTFEVQLVGVQPGQTQ